MEQQIMSLLGGEVAALLPGMTGVAPPGTEPGAAPLPFAEVLNSALDGLIAPDAASLALLSSLLTAPLSPSVSAPVEQSLTLPLPVTELPAATPGTLATGSAPGGNDLPLGGNELPQFIPVALQNSPAASATHVRTETANFDAERKQILLNDTALSLVPFKSKLELPEPSAIPSAITQEQSGELEQPLPSKIESFSVVASANHATAQRDGRNDERAANQQKGTAVMESLSALSSAMSPFKTGETVVTPDNPSGAMLSAVPRVAESMSSTLDNGMLVTGPVNTPLANSPAAKTEFSIPQTPQQPGWGDAFVERVTFMVKQNLQEAEIRLNPPQLGQIDVRISFANDQASLVFSSPHASVRDAIESSMVRLRDLLGESGISLGNVDVSDKSLAQQQKEAESERDFSRDSASKGYRSERVLAENASDILGSSGSGRIDYFV